MKMNQKTTERVVKPHLLRCRPGDWNHAQRVADWVIKLGRDEWNLPLILTAAYVHDIGWRDLVEDEKMSLDQLRELEPQANNNSSPNVWEVCNELGYPEEDIQTILRLVVAADSRKSSQRDEDVIVDADALSKLDINHLKEKYQPSEWMRLYNVWEEQLSQRTKTKQAKKEYPKLLAKLKEDIQKEL